MQSIYFPKSLDKSPFSSPSRRAIGNNKMYPWTFSSAKKDDNIITPQVKLKRGFLSVRMHNGCEKSLLLCLIYVGITITVILYFYGCYRGNADIASEMSCDHRLDAGMVSIPISDIMSGEPVQLPQDHESIVKYIWDNNFIEFPSKGDYSLDNPEENPSKGQGQFIQDIFENMTDGFFVEAGALDGETRSNTLFLEMNLGWNGLLVEGDPINYANLKRRNRKSWISSTCLSLRPYPHKAEFLQSFSQGQIVGSKLFAANREIVTVQCMPLFSLLSALNVTTVDYFSLDVEGSELKILKTIPFDKVLIKTLSVEFSHTFEGVFTLLDFMDSNGYDKIGEVRNELGLANDFIFAHKEVISTK